MLLDPSAFGSQVRPDAQVCVVGGGVCGLTLAHALAGRGVDVLLLESGGRGLDRAAQELNQGDVRGDAYTGLVATRHRQLGGTPHIWNTSVGSGMGAKYVPLDPEDFADWPWSAENLAPWYRAAHELCGLGPFRYDATDWLAPGDRLLTGPGDPLRSGVYQLGRREVFTQELPAALLAASNVRVVPGATVTRLIRDGERLTELEVARPNGTRYRIHPDAVVLAAGAIENARLLLASGFESDWLGRGFMEHPRDRSLVLVPRSVESLGAAAFYDTHPGPGGTLIHGRLTLSPASRRDHRLPNASISLFLRRRPAQESRGKQLLRRLQLLSPPFQGGYGWSRHPERDQAFDAFRLVVNLEQRPHRDNRITLGPDRDRLGVPKALLTYRWRNEEQVDLDRLRSLLATWFADSGHGVLQYQPGLPPDPNAHHHAGTTRMATEARDGVVSPEGRLHGSRNLYVVGSSVFPSAGFANPTLTAVALALRMADHLASSRDSAR